MHWSASHASMSNGWLHLPLFLLPFLPFAVFQLFELCLPNCFFFFLRRVSVFFISLITLKSCWFLMPCCKNWQWACWYFSLSHIHFCSCQHRYQRAKLVKLCSCWWPLMVEQQTFLGSVLCKPGSPFRYLSSLLAMWRLSLLTWLLALLLG